MCLAEAAATSGGAAFARPRTREHARAISFCRSVRRRGSVGVVHLHPQQGRRGGVPFTGLDTYDKSARSEHPTPFTKVRDPQ